MNINSNIGKQLFAALGALLVIQVVVGLLAYNGLAQLGDNLVWLAHDCGRANRLGIGGCSQDEHAARSAPALRFSGKHARRVDAHAGRVGSRVRQRCDRLELRSASRAAREGKRKTEGPEHPPSPGACHNGSTAGSSARVSETSARPSTG